MDKNKYTPAKIDVESLVFPREPVNGTLPINTNRGKIFAVLTMDDFLPDRPFKRSFSFTSDMNKQEISMFWDTIRYMSIEKAFGRGVADFMFSIPSCVRHMIADICINSPKTKLYSSLQDFVDSSLCDVGGVSEHLGVFPFMVPRVGSMVAPDYRFKVWPLLHRSLNNNILSVSEVSGMLMSVGGSAGSPMFDSMSKMLLGCLMNYSANISSKFRFAPENIEKVLHVSALTGNIDLPHKIAEAIAVGDLNFASNALREAQGAWDSLSDMPSPMWDDRVHPVFSSAGFAWQRVHPGGLGAMRDMGWAGNLFHFSGGTRELFKVTKGDSSFAVYSYNGELADGDLPPVIYAKGRYATQEETIAIVDSFEKERDTIAGFDIAVINRVPRMECVRRMGAVSLTTHNVSMALPDLRVLELPLTAHFNKMCGTPSSDLKNECWDHAGIYRVLYVIDPDTHTECGSGLLIRDPNSHSCELVSLTVDFAPLGLKPDELRKKIMVAAGKEFLPKGNESDKGVMAIIASRASSLTDRERSFSRQCAADVLSDINGSMFQDAVYQIYAPRMMEQKISGPASDPLAIKSKPHKFPRL